MEPTGTSYQITITLNDATLNALMNGGFSLCTMKATATTAGGGQPLAWQVTKQFATSMSVQWTSACAVATIQYLDDIISVVSAPIDYGQLFDLSTQKTAGGGLPAAMSILNPTPAQYVSGLCSEAGGSYAPTASFPLFGNMMNAFAPIERVLLMFTAYPAQAGKPILRAYSQGLLVDLTSATSRAVSYDINDGWSWEGQQPWAQSVAPNTFLTPLLIQMAAL